MVLDIFRNRLQGQSSKLSGTLASEWNRHDQCLKSYSNLFLFIGLDSPKNHVFTKDKAQKPIAQSIFITKAQHQRLLKHLNTSHRESCITQCPSAFLC